MKNKGRNHFYSYLLILLLLAGWADVSFAQGTKSSGDEAHRDAYGELSMLDSIAIMKIDTDKIYRSKADAKHTIEELICQEYAFLTDTSVSKSSLLYNYYSAKKYGNKIQCTWSYRRKDLRKRWVIKPVYKTVRDTIFEERKDLTGVNFGSNHNPLGTNKPILWHTKYCYDSCLISLSGSSNMDGEDNFLLYTAGNKKRDTICNIRVPCSSGFEKPIYKKARECPYCSQIFIKIYNAGNTHFSPGACSAFLIVKPKYPKVVTIQKRKAVKISQIR